MAVRGDAVVQNSDFWPACVRPSPEAPPPVYVQAWLLGSLVQGFAKRPLTLEFRRSFPIREVIAELGRLCARAFRDREADSGGGMIRNYRVFLDAPAAEGAASPIQTKALKTGVELILPTAAKGG